MLNQIKNEYLPDVVTLPGETLQDILDTIGMTKAELAERIGKTPKHIGEIIKHGAPITPATAMGLEKALGIPASFWNNRERRYRETLARLKERESLKKEVSWLASFPVPEMIKSGWIKRHKEKIDQVDELLCFFGVKSSRQWEKIWFDFKPIYRQSKAFINKPEACSAWLRRGELQTREIDCAPFDREKFKSALGDIRLLTRKEPEQFETKTVRMCADAGVAVVFTSQIKGAPIYGVTRWLSAEKAMIQLSFRGKFEDLLWFTFFHEAGHILFHGKKEIFIEGSDNQEEKEQEADKFATNLLIPSGDWREFLSSENYKSKNAVDAFAAKLEISPAIVVGRLQHEGLIPYSHLNGLRRRFELKTR
jgi:HTH-type transcriptional regulator/antitoxin HigA